MSISAFDFYSKYDGHPVETLNKVIEFYHAKERKIIYFAGDSTLDNKHWLFKNTEHKKNELEYAKSDNFAEAVNGYEELLTPPRQIKDVAYWVNKLAEERKLNLACVNTSIEESTLLSRANGLLPQDQIINKHLRETDTLVVSVGGNDLVNFPSAMTKLAMASLVLSPQALIENYHLTTYEILPWMNVGASIPFGLSHIVGIFRHSMKRYIETLIGKKRPKRIIICMFYYPDLNTSIAGWVTTALNYMGYDKNPEKFQKLTQILYKEGICKIEIPGVDIFRLPFYECLDGSDTLDYVQRAEPSAQGGKKMAEAILQIISNN